VLTQASPTEADRRAWADSLLGFWPPSSARLAMAEDGRPDLSGETSVRLVRRHNSAECGYWVAPERRGRGLASTALGIVADWVFDMLGAGRLSLSTDLDNPASEAVATRSEACAVLLHRSCRRVRADRS
jgi:RimJ/RimL family protein N-acetyltransferase